MACGGFQSVIVALKPVEGELLGRGAELAVIERQIESALAGRGGVMLIGGETGVGKTRLALEALRRAARRGAHALAGACYEGEGDLPYGPFVEILRAALQGMPEAARPSLVTAAGPDLGRLLLLATYREEGAGVGTPLGQLLAGLYREKLDTRIALPPLNADEIAALVARELGGVQPSSDLRRAVVEFAEGNAFFAQEIARSLAEAGGVERLGPRWRRAGDFEDGGPGQLGQGVRVPEGVRGVVQERVARLGSAVQSILGVAAVIGREFEFETLARSITGLDEMALLDGLDAALNARLIEEVPGGFRFRHALTRQVLVDGLSRLRRTRLHAAVADAIEALHPDRLDEFSEALGHHRSRSDRPAPAIPHLIAAGDRATSVFAHDTAIARYRRALELGPAPEVAFRLHEKIGNLYKIVAETEACLSHYDAALALAPDAKSRARIRRKAAAAAITNGELARARSYLDEAIRDLEAEPESLEHARVEYHLAQLRWHENEFPAAYRAAERALQVAERLNGPAELAQAFEMLALACHSLGEWQRGFEYETRRRSIVGDSPDVGEAFDVHL